MGPSTEQAQSGAQRTAGRQPCFPHAGGLGQIIRTLEPVSSCSTWNSHLLLGVEAKNQGDRRHKVIKEASRLKRCLSQWRLLVRVSFAKLPAALLPVWKLHNKRKGDVVSFFFFL